MNLCLGILVTTWLVMQPAAPSFVADWAVVLPADGWKGSHRLCSRPSPNRSGYWAPDPQTIRNLETDLAVALHDALARDIQDASWRPLTRDYYRQYIGIHGSGRRLVYVNGFHRRYIEHASMKQPESRWRTQLVNVCDGGYSFFGADYDPATRKVSNIYFNGRG